MYGEIRRHPKYVVSDHGVVYRVLCQGCYSMLIPDFSNGYARVDLDGVKEYVARLVLETFRPTNDPTLKVFYIDGNKTNNKLDNLCWLSPSDIQRFSAYTVEYRTKILRARD